MTSSLIFLQLNDDFVDQRQFELKTQLQYCLFNFHEFINLLVLSKFTNQNNEMYTLLLNTEDLIKVK